MKTRIFSLAIMSMVLSACTPGSHSSKSFESEHNARIALDWAGTYRGVLPCADCEGIKTAVTLADSGTYQTRSEYLGRRDSVSEEQGRFSWDAAGNTITLDQSEPVKYFVTENRLIRLSSDGSQIKGALADKYILVKDSEQK